MFDIISSSDSNNKNAQKPEFKLYLSNDSYPRACIFQMLGYEITDGNIFGGLIAGDNIKEVNNSNYDLITNIYPREIIPERYVKYLTLFLDDYKKLERSDHIVLEGYSFGAFFTLCILGNADEEDLKNLLSQVKRFRFQGIYFGTYSLGNIQFFLRIFNWFPVLEFSHIHSKYFVKLSIKIKTFLMFIKLRIKGDYFKGETYFFKKLIDSYDWKHVKVREDLMFKTKSLYDHKYEEMLRSAYHKPKITMITSTKDIIISYKKVMKSYKLFSNTGFDIKLIFIERIRSKLREIV